VATTRAPPLLAAAGSGLIGRWTFDGKDMPSGQVNDVSGQGNHGSARNMATTTMRVAGPIGQALSFDGSDDSVNTGDIAAMNGASALTVAGGSGTASQSAYPQYTHGSSS
jgi:hypothetical protein